MRYLLVLFLLLAIGCTDTKDSVVSGGEFSVYFDNAEDHDLAKEIVVFWKEDSLITGRPQDVRLQRKKIGYDLTLVSPNRKSMAELSFDEVRSLTKLQQRLQRKVFKDKEVTLVIGDESFKPLFTPTL
jgi:hypothetical protein